MEYELNVEGISKEAIMAVANDADAECIITAVDKQANDFFDIDILKELDISEEEEEKENFYTIQVFREAKPAKEYELKKTKTIHFSGIVAEILSDTIKKGYVKQGMKVLFVTNASLTKKYQTSLLVIDVDRTIYKIGKFKLAENLSSETIIEKVIELAQEIGLEGREGKKVGTLFVIGNIEELKPYCRQLIMNPFKGYEKDHLNIVQNTSLNETIKNFAQLDGAFIIDHEGHLISAGTYLDVDTTNVKPYQGWGTKHLAATAITKETNAIAILVSESGGKVKIFKNGKLIFKLN